MLFVYLFLSLALLAYLSPAPAGAAYLFGIKLPKWVGDVASTAVSFVPGVGPIVSEGADILAGLLSGGDSTGANSQPPHGTQQSPQQSPEPAPMVPGMSNDMLMWGAVAVGAVLLLPRLMGGKRW